MNIDNIVQNLKNDNSHNRVIRSDFVQFMEKVNDPFIALIATILSLRTNDRTTYPATLKMLKLGSTPKDFADLKPDILAQAIYPVGFYKNKAEQIIEIAKKLCSEYECEVPNSIDELVKFKGVGRKTANLVLTKGFGIPAICVDIHVHRICNRLGYVKTKTPDETEMVLRKILPKKYWIDFNTLLVTHGQNVCKPIKPKCEICSIAHHCEFFRALK